MEKRGEKNVEKFPYLGACYRQKPDDFTGIAIYGVHPSIEKTKGKLYFKAKKLSMPKTVKIERISPKMLDNQSELLLNEVEVIDVYKHDNIIYRFVAPPDSKYNNVIAMFFLGTIASYDYYTAFIDFAIDEMLEPRTQEEYWNALLNNVDPHLNVSPTQLYTVKCGRLSFENIGQPCTRVSIIAHSNSNYKCAFLGLWTQSLYRYKDAGAVMLEGYPAVTNFKDSDKPMFVVYTDEGGKLVCYEFGSKSYPGYYYAYRKQELCILDAHDIFETGLEEMYNKFGKVRPTASVK